MTDDPDAAIRFTPTFDDVLASRKLGSPSALWRYGFGTVTCGRVAAAVTATSHAFSLAASVIVAVVVGLA